MDQGESPGRRYRQEQVARRNGSTTTTGGLWQHLQSPAARTVPTVSSITPGAGDGATHPHHSELVDEARSTARQMLEGLDDGGHRWHHTQAVAARAAQAAVTFDPNQADCLTAAAWLHDIGYAPTVAHHHFHPVDGATYIQDHLASDTVAGLVAHHSGARFIAAVLGLNRLMLPFARTEYWNGPLADALTWADQPTGPDGQTVTVEERLREMLMRHGPDSPNARCNTERAPVLIAAAHATEARLDRYRRAS